MNLSRRSSPLGNAGAPLGPLTRREQIVLDELSTCDTYQDIAARLFISHNTMKSHVKAIYRKLGVRNRMAAVAAATHLGSSGERPEVGV